MAEGFEPFHVPQQIRRDKLRFLGHESPNFHPIYDPSLELPPTYDFHQPLAGDSKPNAAKAKAAANLVMGNYAITNPNFPDMLPLQQINPFLYDDQTVNGSGSLQSLSRHDPIMGTGQGLSLSLSSPSQRNPHQEIFNRAGSISVGPLGPFTGYASILSGSRFLRPARQLLEEFCGLGSEGQDPLKLDADSPVDSLGEVGAPDGADDNFVCGGKPKLISMLDEVYRKYKQYYQQLQAVVASFESVSGLGNAAPYANLALKAMSRHFRSLKNAITGQLQFTKKAHGLNVESQNGPYISCPRPVQNLGFLEPHQPVWRTQRGLPERAVTVLRAWLFEHFLHPYPSDTDKIMLAKQTGLSRSQVSNWFINARVRLWKPMVEEIHILETRQASQTTSQGDERSRIGTINAPNDHHFENPSPRFLEPQYKDHQQLPMNYCYGELPNDPRGACGSSSVSLTLGLHNGNGFEGQNRHFMGDPNGGDFVMGDAFEGQNRHFGGQLLHDFVG